MERIQVLYYNTRTILQFLQKDTHYLIEDEC